MAAQQFFCNFRPVVGQDPPFSYLGRSKGEARTETQETSTLIAGLRKGDPLRWWVPHNKLDRSSCVFSAINRSHCGPVEIGEFVYK